MKTEVYKIGGMSCAACSSSVERVTRALEGVSESSVNLMTEKMTITYDETVLNPETIISEVEDIGFDIEIYNPEAPKKPETEKPEIKEDGFSDKTRLIVALSLAAIILYISMGTMLIDNLPIPVFLNINTHPMNYATAQMLIAVCAMFIGRKFFIGGYRSLFHKAPNMDALVAVSCSCSFIYSLVMTMKITDSPNAVHSLYFESCAVVLALIMLGKYLEGNSKEKTKDAIKSLMALAPEQDDLSVGDELMVKAGMAYPSDGVVIDGETNADESMLTGESVAVPKKPGDNVIGGSINLTNPVRIRITKVGRDTVLSHIIELVEEAQGKKAPIAKLADKIAGIFVPSVMSIALLAAVIWLIAGQSFGFALRIFTTVLVIACPCALGLATPTAIIVGTGMGAKKGILIRSGEALQKASEVDTVVFDKTGTLTYGNLSDTSKDTIRPESKEAVAKLKELGLNVYMLSGDKAEIAKAIAAEAGIENVVSDVLPGGKGTVITDLQKDGLRVMMVGDGVNDAPALAAADIGLAIGSGTDVAMNSADVVLMRSDPTDVARAVRLSKLTMRTIKQNLFWAFFYNCIGIPIAAGVLYPATGLLLSPMIGGLAMACSSVFVVTNALRLKTKKID